MTPLIVKVALMFIDWLIKDRAEREKIKLQLLKETAKYNRGVLDSALLRREWDDLTRAFDETPGR